MKGAAAMAALAFTAGCAMVPPRAAGGDWIAGRLAVSVAATAAAPARQLASAFELRGDERSGELRLLSPIGSVMARAQWQPGAATLTAPDGERRYSSLEALSVGALGEALPLQALPSWLHGRAWAGAASTPVDGGFEQLGWRIDMTRFADGAIDIARAAPPATLRVRLEAPS